MCIYNPIGLIQNWLNEIKLEVYSYTKSLCIFSIEPYIWLKNMIWSNLVCGEKGEQSKSQGWCEYTVLYSKSLLLKKKKLQCIGLGHLINRGFWLK